MNFHKIVIKFQKWINKKLSIADAAVVVVAAAVVVVYAVVVVFDVFAPFFPNLHSTFQKKSRKTIFRTDDP